MFLMPVFLLALIPVEQILTQKLLLLFVALHVFVYPSSNAVNSYYDQDEGPIGGLEHPPEADRATLDVGLASNLIGLAICGLFINWACCLAVFLYSAVSFAYSHPAIRLKAHPLLSTLAVAVFQGPLVVLAVWLASDFMGLGSSQAIFMLIGSALLLTGSYPLTQLYQIEEDLKRGDNTLASRLGALGAINFSGAAFAGFALCMYLSGPERFFDYLPYLTIAMLPGAIGVGLMLRTISLKKEIGFKMVMWQNMVSSGAFIVGHIAFLIFR